MDLVNSLALPTPNNAFVNHHLKKLRTWYWQINARTPKYHLMSVHEKAKGTPVTGTTLVVTCLTQGY